MSVANISKKVFEQTLDTIFDEIYAKWGGDERIDKEIAVDIQVPVFAGERFKALQRKVNALMERQLDLPLDNIWRVELRENDRVKITDFTMPSSSPILTKTIPISEAPKFIRDGLAVLQISRDALQVDGVGKRINESVYYIVERVDGGDTRKEGERCS